jgi:hypothetical protein
MLDMILYINIFILKSRSNPFTMKKKIFLLTITILFSIIAPSFSQDIITMRDGDEVKVKITEVLPDAVKYKKFDNLDGPIYTESKTNIFMIKYKNGTKDVFKQVAPEIVVSTSDEINKKQALDKLIAVFTDKFKGDAFIKFLSLTKTNGTIRNIDGQNVYEINFELTIQFIRDGYKIGNGMEGYWSNFKVFATKPNLNEAEAMMYTPVLFPMGTTTVIQGVARMSSSDNGYEFKNYDVSKVAIISPPSGNSSPDNSKPANAQPFPGFYNSVYPDGNIQTLNNTLYYKGNTATITNFSLGGITNESLPGNVITNSNVVLSTFLYLNGFTRANDQYSYTYSLCVTLDNGEEFEKKEGVQNYITSEPCIVQFDYNTPTINSNQSKYFKMNFVVKDNNSGAVVQGFYRFSVAP